MTDTDLSALFLHGLKDISFTEHAILDALPKMADAATSPKLKEALDNHVRQTKGHVKRLDQIFDLIQEKPVQVPCDAIQGLVREGDEIVEKFEGSRALDAGLIAAAQAVEHYKMARYGALKPGPRNWICDKPPIFLAKRWRRKDRPIFS